MLLEKQNLDGSYPGAVVQRTQRIVDADHVRLSRFHSVVDDNGYETGSVTKHYQLVKNADLIGAIDLASDNIGLDITAGSGRYYHGRSQYTFYLPDSFRVPGDPSDIRPQIVLGNSYGGKAALTGTAGVYRVICTNGMIAGKVVRADYQRHIGSFDLLPFVTELITAVVSRANEYQTMALVAAETAFHTRVNAALSGAAAADLERNRAFLVDLAATTPKKYRSALKDSILSNRRELGETVWGILQAIAEVSSHDMAGSWAADTWQHKQTEKVLVLAGINS